MAEKTKSTVVGVFHDIEHADKAVNALLRAGFRHKDISFIHRRATKGQAMKTDAEHYSQVTTTRVAEGALAGSLVGGLIGTVTTLILPGFGALYGAGILIASLAGAGAIGGSFAAYMSTVGVSEEEANWFKGELEKGRPLVAVRVDGRYSEALAIMQENGAEDMTRQKEAEPRVPAAPRLM